MVVTVKIALLSYNPNGSLVRQRFAITHEIGHFVLHKKQASEKIFVDKDFLVKYRNSKSYSSSEHRDEQAANAFAAELLMPENLI